jgi:hypothetical protein
MLFEPGVAAEQDAAISSAATIPIVLWVMVRFPPVTINLIG